MGHGLFVNVSIKSVDKLLWPVTMGCLGMFFLLAVIMFISAVTNIRDTLIIFTVSSLLAVIILWGLASVYVTAAVAIADLCHEPTTYVKHVMESSFNLSKDISNYYLNCNDNETRMINPSTTRKTLEV